MTQWRHGFAGALGEDPEKGWHREDLGPQRRWALEDLEDRDDGGFDDEHAWKAHFAPQCKIDVYVELPPEDRRNECGKLIHWLCGLPSCGTGVEGKSVPVAFVHQGRDTIGVVHGDHVIWHVLEK